MSLTRTDISESICKLCAYSKNRSEKLVESTLEIVKRALESGEDVLISGFGKFCVKEKNSRNGRKPISGDKAALEAKRAVVFKCSRVLRGKLNGKG